MKRLMLGFVSLLLAACGLGGSGPYHQKDGMWFFENEHMRVPDGETVIPLNNRFAKTATLAFYRSSIIDGADAGTFTAITESYAKDKSHVWYADTYRNGQEYFSIVHDRILELSDADPASFVSLDTPHAEHDLGYARDRGHVWFDGKLMAVGDLASFQVQSYGFARDNTTGYYMRQPVPGSDGRTFAQIDNAYSRDARHIFFSDVVLGQPSQIVNRVVEGADRASFAPLERGYAKDAHTVYFDGVAIPGADPASFVMLGAGDAAGEAHDKSGDWRDGKRAVAEPATPPADPNEKMGDEVGPEPVPGQ